MGFGAWALGYADWCSGFGAWGGLGFRDQAGLVRIFGLGSPTSECRRRLLIIIGTLLYLKVCPLIEELMEARNSCTINPSKIPRSPRLRGLGAGGGGRAVTS